MWMPEFGITHNVVMAVGWLMGFALLGGFVYFAITIRADNGKSPKE